VFELLALAVKLVSEVASIFNEGVSFLDRWIWFERC
jgi:hypothetical protein